MQDWRTLARPVDDEQDDWRALARPLDDEPTAPSGAFAAIAQPFAGVNRGLDNAFQAVSGAGRLVTDRAFEGVNALAGRQIFDTSAPSARPIQRTQQAVAGQDYNDLPVNTAYDRYAQRIGEEIGASAPAAFGVGLAARGTQATNAVANAARSGNTGRAVIAPAIQEAARRPGAYMAAEAASAAASGAGAQAARDIAPGNAWAEMAGQIAAPLGLFGGAAAARAGFRGVGDDARRAAQAAVDDAARAGTTPTAAQLNVRDGRVPIGGTIQNTVGRMPGGASTVSRRLAQQEDEIAQRVSALARGGRRAAVSPEEAGRAIKDGIEGYRTRFQQEAGELYGEVDRLIPPETPAPMTNARRVAQEILDEGVSGQLGDRVNDSRSRLLAQAIAADEPRTYADLARTRTQIGEMLNDQDLIGTRAEGALKRIYGGLTEDIADVASGREQVFRGLGGDSGGGNYFTPDRDFARNFTRSGRDSEIQTRYLDRSDIYEPNELPFAGNPEQIDAAIAEAQRRGARAFRVDEGEGQPSSVFVFDRAALQRSPSSAPGAQDALTRANQFYRDGASRLENHLQPLLRGDRADVPEQLFRAVERGGKDGATRVRELRFAVGDDQWSDVSSAVLDRMGRATPGQQDAEGTAFSAETFLTNWNRVFSDEAKDAFFGTSDQQFRQDLDAIARTLSRRRDAARVLANPSGTAAATANIAGLTGIGSAVLSSRPDLAALGGAGIGILYGAGDLITRPWFARWAAQAIEGPTERMPTYLARLSATAQMAGTPEEQERVNQLIEQAQNQGQQRGSDYRQQ